MLAMSGILALNGNAFLLSEPITNFCANNYVFKDSLEKNMYDYADDHECIVFGFEIS